MKRLHYQQDENEFAELIVAIISYVGHFVPKSSEYTPSNMLKEKK